MKEKELERVMKALANRRRLLIISFIKKNKEARVGEIAGGIRLSFKATSKHLGILLSSDILEREQRSLEMYYSINKDCPTPAKAIFPFL